MAKVFVEVTARFTRDGRLEPLSVIWENGKKYKIDRVLKCEWCASYHAGATEVQYTCIVGGKECHLYYDRNRQWFMERKSA